MLSPLVDIGLEIIGLEDNPDVRVKVKAVVRGEVAINILRQLKGETKREGKVRVLPLTSKCVLNSSLES